MERNAIAQISVRQHEHELFRRRMEEERRRLTQLPGGVAIDPADWTERPRQLRKRMTMPPITGTSWRQHPSVR